MGHKTVGVMNMKEFLFCIDSDGCAIDSMDIKHFTAFGPCAIDVWSLGEWKDDLLSYWNEVNLYSKTRGINRFLGLEKLLCRVDEKYRKIDGLDEYRTWCRTTKVYSPSALPAEGDIFIKARDWSDRVNAKVATLGPEIKPFDGVKEALEAVRESSDIAIVSSANTKAVMKEWTEFGLMQYVDHFMSQDAGTKTECIAKLLNMGYGNVVMIGDAPGDLAAADSNGVSFFPIITGKEKESWAEVRTLLLPAFTSNSYKGEYELRKRAEFEESLK